MVTGVLLAVAVFTTGARDAAPATPLAPVEADGQQMVACESGGPFADTCQINCHIIFNFYTKSCSVTCRSGYFACCSCDGGCQCIIDHDEVNPLPTPDSPIPLW